jgi:hopanoid-associated phosphorylase
MNQQTTRTLAVTGLAFEAAIAGRDPRVRVCCGQGDRLQDALRNACDDDCAGIISFGIAAALDPSLLPGTAVVASSILTDEGQVPTDEAWSAILSRGCKKAVSGKVLGVSGPVLDKREKEQLFAETGAVAVDMESAVAAQVAIGTGIRLAALRVIADTAGTNVPEAAMRGWRSDGTVDVAAVLLALLRSPTGIAPILRLTRQSFLARRALVHASRGLGSGFGLFDVG